MNTNTVLTKKAKRAAKRLFARKPHNTRAFTSADYNALPKDNYLKVCDVYSGKDN